MQIDKAVVACPVRPGVPFDDSCPDDLLVRTCPRLRRDSPTSAPGLAHICAGTRACLH